MSKYREYSKQSDQEKATRAEWQKTNTVMITARLMKSTDADILTYLDQCQSRQGTIKTAMREYMHNHPITYRVRPEYYDLWNCTADTAVVDINEIIRLSAEWEKPIAELLEQTDRI